jgi:hypothetical protein
MKESSVEAANLTAAVTSRNVPAAPPASVTPKVETPATPAPRTAADAPPVAAPLPERIEPSTEVPIRPSTITYDSPRASGLRHDPQPEHEGSSAAPEFRAIQIKPRPSQPAAAPAIVVEERGNPRQSRITIGKVDVQVNNRRPVQNVVSSRMPSHGPRSDFLEARYLSRFPMRP